MNLLCVSVLDLGLGPGLLVDLGTHGPAKISKFRGNPSRFLKIPTSVLNWEPHPTNDWFVLIWGVIRYQTFHHICHSKSFQRCETGHQASKQAWTRMQITKQKSQTFALAYVYRTLYVQFCTVPVWIRRVAIRLALAFCVLACNPVPCGLHRTMSRSMALVASLTIWLGATSHAAAKTCKNHRS